MGTDSFIVYIKTDDIYKEFVEVVKNRFDTSNYKLGRSLPKRKNKNVNGLMKDEFDGKIMTKYGGINFDYLSQRGDLKN